MSSLATKYRPHIFDQVLGQESIIKILKAQVEQNKLKNCYLFCGPSGDGKTTLARIFSNQVNKGVGRPIEIDGASNNGVDNVRQIIKSAQQRSIQGKYKIYIIDQCHALSNAAWQSFLKCIEEPPEFTIFIFCTTDPQKIPATICNRVMRFNFTRVPSKLIKLRLYYICEQQGFINYEETCDYLSRICNGGVRDAIAMLEKCAGYDTDLNISNCLSALGNYSYQTFFDLTNSIIDNDQKSVLKLISQFYSAGNDLKLFVESYLTFCMDLQKYIIFGDCSVTSLPSNVQKEIKHTVGINNALQYFNYITGNLLQLKNMLKTDINPKCTIEVMLLKLCRCN